MVRARLATVALAVAGLFGVPLSFATIGGYPNLKLPENKPAEPYKPPPVGCQKWIGRGFMSRYRGASSACVNGCQVTLSGAEGYTAYWTVTGAPCQPIPRVAPVVPVEATVEPPAQAEGHSCYMIGQGNLVREYCGPKPGVPRVTSHEVKAK